MDSNAQPNSAADAPSAVVPSCREWQLLALTRPARVRTASGFLETAPRLWLDWIVQAAQSTLAKLLHRPVQIDITGRAASAKQENGFGVTFRLIGQQGEAAVVFDQALARAVASALESEMAGVSASGPLSRAEIGLLEYAALACLDDGLVRIAPAGAGFSIQRFLAPRDLGHWKPPEKATALSLLVTVAGRSGEATLWLPESLTKAVSAADLPQIAESTAGGESLSVRLALPPIALSIEEYQRLTPGDILLLDATDLASFASQCCLVTSTGWRLGSATIVNDLPTVVTVRCGELQPRADDAESNGDGVIIRPLVGRIDLTLDQLRQWQSGATMDFPKDAQTPVELCVGSDSLGGGELVAGEFVKAQGTLGVRLLTVAPLTEGK